MLSSNARIDASSKIVTEKVEKAYGGGRKRGPKKHQTGPKKSPWGDI